ncbi:DUF742 domain-containing protein [Streptomyces sp. SID4919]|uniref:DUF742 domain-containing protein n=1 Tax=Streptomyces uncialis TaxID=1048205 RepID=A0A1Q4V6B2_9ACTN|nr:MULTISPECIES: DUF742 domain-containing protein [Streptomyces]MCX4659606.1 DUF742 domain-containing protein [Streptomyces uncialis]MYY07671.1 DUF742 domain-containing protein [Streptomyces sp. SID4919]OKH93361.1 hypothetical protein AB852_17660 [Streptomyces uncialis]WST67703.1 DUF742 domain-containing protein [Streptomyces uncialis]WTE13669.1 DUF742 domain-containing protein [Streptomyces uncialis]
MTAPGEEQPVSGGFIRSYVITGGRTLPDAEELSLVTLVTIGADRTPPARPSPEVQAIWTLCVGGYLSVAEVAGRLGLPVGVVRLLLTDLADQGHLLRRAAPPAAKLVDRKILEEVLHGLQRRFG